METRSLHELLSGPNPQPNSSRWTRNEGAAPGREGTHSITLASINLKARSGSTDADPKATALENKVSGRTRRSSPPGKLTARSRRCGVPGRGTRRTAGRPQEASARDTAPPSGGRSGRPRPCSPRPRPAGRPAPPAPRTWSQRLGDGEHEQEEQQEGTAVCLGHHLSSVHRPRGGRVTPRGGRTGPG